MSLECLNVWQVGRLERWGLILTGLQRSQGNSYSELLASLLMPILALCHWLVIIFFPFVSKKRDVRAITE